MNFLIILGDDFYLIFYYFSIFFTFLDIFWVVRKIENIQFFVAAGVSTDSL